MDVRKVGRQVKEIDLDLDILLYRCSIMIIIILLYYIIDRPLFSKLTERFLLWCSMMCTPSTVKRLLLLIDVGGADRCRFKDPRSGSYLICSCPTPFM